MIRFSVRTLARWISRRPNWCLAIAFTLTVAAMVLLTNRLSIEMDMSELLPEDSEVYQIRRDALMHGSFDFMLAVLEANEPDSRETLKAAARELASYLEDDRYIRTVTYTIDAEALDFGNEEADARLVALLTEEDWVELESRLRPNEVRKSLRTLLGFTLNPTVTQAQIRRRLDDPLNFSRVLQERIRVKSGPLKVNIRDNFFMSEDGQMVLVLMWPVAPATDLAFAQDFQQFLEGTRRGLFQRHPEWGSADAPEDSAFRVYFFGPHYETISDSRVVKDDFYRTSIMSFIAVMCLFFFAFRRPEALFFVATPLIIGVIWTLGIASLYPGRLTQVTIAFSAILFGLGIDFSVHLYNRYLEEVRLGRNNREALRQAIIETGPGIIAGALTTAIAFFGMMITSFVGFRELGFVSGLGILCCLAAVILVLPPMLAHLGTGRFGGFTKRPMSTFGLKRFHYLASAYPRITVGGALIVCIYLGFHARDVRFEDDFRMLKQPSDSYIALRDRISSHFQVPDTQVIIIAKGDTFEAALEDNDRLFRNIASAETRYPLIAKDSLRYFFPSEATQRRQLERMVNQPLDQVELTIRNAARENQIDPEVLEPFIDRLRRLQQAATKALASEAPPINLDRIDDRALQAFWTIANRYVISDPDREEWRIVTRLYPPPGPPWSTSVPPAFRGFLDNELRRPPDITGSVIIQEELRRVIIRDLAITVLVVLGAVLVYLLVHFGSAKKALLVLVPVIMSLVSMLGIVHLFDMHLHYLNIVALPMVVGIGVDAGIHLIQRYYEDDAQNLRLAVTRTGRAVMITGLTTIFGFGALSLANFRGIRELGLFSILGVSLTLFSALVVLPAMLRLLQPKVLYQGGQGDDLG